MTILTRANELATGPWQRHLMALEEVDQRLRRICAAFAAQGVPFAIVGGLAVAQWVATRDPAAVRTTKDVDLLLRRDDLPRARAAASAADMDYFEVMNVGMFLERTDPNPRKGVHLVWAGEKVKADCALPSPTMDEREELEPGLFVVSLAGLVRMKLMANRDHDRAHLRDMIEVNLVSREILVGLPRELAERLDWLLIDCGK